MLFRRIAGWLGHVARRTPGHSLPYAALFGSLPHRVCPPSSERSCVEVHYTSTARLVVQQMPGVDERVWARAAQDRVRWQRSIMNLRIDPPARRQASVRAAPRAQRRPQPGVDPLQCLSCDYRARNKQGLSNHLREKHPVAASSWTCPHCGKVYKHRGYYTMHLEQCSAAPGPAVAPPPPVPARAAARSSSSRDFVCTYRGCGLTFVSASQQRRHEREQCLRRPGSGAITLPSGDVRLPCPSPGCTETFANTRALGVHKKRAHGL